MKSFKELLGRFRSFGLFYNAARLFYSLKENIARSYPHPHQGLGIYNLLGHQVYPEGVNFDLCLLAEIKREYSGLKLKADTPIASIGSCFAERIADHLIQNKYNYLMVENNAWHSSANWGRVYTVPGFTQIVDYSIDENYPIIIEETKCRSFKRKEAGWFDPLRDGSHTYPDKSEAINEIITHRRSSFSVFHNARVLVLTLGQNEAWLDQKNNIVWANRPPQDILDAASGRFENRAFEQNVVLESLLRSLHKLFKMNPQMQVLLTLSPVPAAATFKPRGVIIQSFINKCLLRVVIDEVAKHFKGKVFYFPSFEMVLAYNPGTFKADNRHIGPARIKNIIELFDSAMFNGCR